MQGPSEKNIPNFNKRKRPRQALYAFPGKGSQNTGKTKVKSKKDISCIQMMDMIKLWHRSRSRSKS